MQEADASASAADADGAREQAAYRAALNAQYRDAVAEARLQARQAANPADRASLMLLVRDLRRSYRARMQRLEG